MNKKTIVAFSFLTLLSVVGSIIFSDHNLISSTSSASNSNWYHYNKIDSTYDTKGCKEYWTNCAGTTLINKPDVSSNQIIEKGRQSQAFIDSLSDSDERLINKSRQLISFENDSDINLITSRRNNFASKEVISDTSTDGDHCLKLTFKDGTADYQLPISYLDEAFNDSNVVAINFDVKGNYEKTYFSYYLNGTGVSYEKQGSTNFGLTTNWKTFSYPRSAYESYKSGSFSNNAIMWTTISANTGIIYLDNIRPVIKEHDSYGIEGYRLVERSAGDDYLKKASIRDENNKETVVLLSNEETDYGFSYSNKSEGNRSLYIHKSSSSTVLLCLPKLSEELSDDDIISFDIYTSCDFESNNITRNLVYGNNEVIGKSNDYVHKSGKWVTYNLTKDNFSGNVAMKFKGNIEGNIYVDNVTINKKDKNEKGFERTHILKESNQNYIINGRKCDEYTNEQDYLLKVIGDNSLSYVNYSKSVKSEGEQSLLFTRSSTSGYTQLYISKDLSDQIKNNEASVTFDLYSTIAVNSRNSANNLSNGLGNRMFDYDYTHPAYTWKTYQINANGITNDGRFLIIRGSSLGDYYIDNITVNGPTTLDYSNAKVLYIGQDTPINTFKLTNKCSSIKNIRIDGISIDNSLFNRVDNYSFTLSNSGFTSEGRKEISIVYSYNDTVYKDVIYADINLVSNIGQTNVSATYGSNDYLTTPLLSSDYYRVTYKNNEVPYQVDDNNKINIAHGSLITLLNEESGKKVDGTLELCFIGLEKKNEYKVNVSITNDKTVRSLETFNGEGIDTYAYSSTSSHASSSNYASYINTDTILDYDNTGLDLMYVQSCSLPYNATSLPNNYRYIFSKAGEIGQKVMIIDQVFSLLSKEEDTLIGRDIKINDSLTLHFNTTDELDNYVVSRLNIVVNEESCYGETIGDEPTYAQLLGGCKDLMPSIRRALTKLNKNDFKIHLNLLPMTAGENRLTGSGDNSNISEKYYETYLNTYLSVIGNDYDFIQYDLYALADNTKNNTYFDNKKGLNAYYLQNLLIAAKYAKNNGKNLRVVTQSFTYQSSGNRIFTYSDFAFMNNMLLAFGVKNISYFVYQNRASSSTSSEGWYDTQTFLTVDGEKNNTYYYMQSIISTINTFEKVISDFDYDYSHLYYYLFNKNSAKMYTNMTGSSYYDSSSSYEKLSSISVSKDWALVTGLKNKNDNSKIMYAIQNVYNSFGANLYQSIKLTFNQTINYAVIYESGLPRVVDVNSKNLTLKLSSGNAAYLLLY